MEDWCKAVNEHGGFGQWDCAVSWHPGDVQEILKAKAHRSGQQRIGFMAGEVDVPALLSH